MADLSPSAQAVRDAAEEVAWDWGNMTQAHHTVIAAAVLRAAADHVGEWESAQELRAIAAELENNA